jgi:hypothetical protein
MNLSDPIVPGVSAAGVRIGDDIKRVLLGSGAPSAVHGDPGRERYEFGTVTIWAKAGRVEQIGVRKPYEGRLASGVGLGSTIADVVESTGTVIEDDEENLVVAGQPGWCFETEEWAHGQSLSDNADARISEIFVFESRA